MFEASGEGHEKGRETEQGKIRLQESGMGQSQSRCHATPCAWGWGDPALPLGIVCLLNDDYIHTRLESIPGQAWLAAQHVLGTVLSVFSPQETRPWLK